MNKKIYLNGFIGFYNTYIDIMSIADANYLNNLICDEENKKEYTPDELYDMVNIDYLTYEKDFGNDMIEFIKDNYGNKLNDIGIKILNFEKIVSPKYYNYGSDEIEYAVEYDIDKILNFINDNSFRFAEKIKKENTTHDGYIPFGENNLKEFLEKISKSGDFEPFELSQIIDFYFEINNIDLNQIIFDINNNIDIDNYITIK